MALIEIDGLPFEGSMVIFYSELLVITRGYPTLTIINHMITTYYCNHY